MISKLNALLSDLVVLQHKDIKAEASDSSLVSLKMDSLIEYYSKAVWMIRQAAR